MRPSVILTAVPAPAKGGNGKGGDGNGGDGLGSVTLLGADVPRRVG